MISHLSTASALFLSVVVLVTSACTQVEQGQAPHAAQVDRVWPNPPAEPRIRYLYSLASERDVEKQPGALRTFWRWLKGVPERPLMSPYGVYADAAGKVFVVDTFYKAVKVFDLEEGGGYWFPEQEIPGFVNPIDIVQGPAGELFVSDSVAGVVHVFLESGREYKGTIGAGQLERPTGLAVDRDSGELWVVDTKASRLAVFDPDSGRLKRNVGSSGDGAQGFHFPTSVAVADDGGLYVVDSMNFRVQVLGSDAVVRQSFGAAGDAPGYFSRPKGVALDGEGHVYVVDALFDNVQLFDPEGRLLMAFGEPGNGIGEFWLPNDIHIDGQNRIFVSDSENHRVQVFEFMRAAGTSS